MKQTERAFFYEYKYYLFPDEIKTLEELKKKEHVTCTRLKEERCMAPDFIFESMAEETLEIKNPEHLFETSVTLRTAEEYDEILTKQVTRVCPGCERYSNEDEPDLNGHHREISLDGICYEREGKDDSWDFATCVNIFWYRISTQVNELAKCVDARNQKKLNAILNGELGKVTFPAKFYGGVHEGKYCLMFLPDFDHVPFIRFLYRYFAECASREVNEMKQAGWEVFPCRKKGAYVYSGKHNFRKVFARIVPAENPDGCALEIYCKTMPDDKKRRALYQDLFDYLAGCMGEERVCGILSEVSVVTEKTGVVPVADLVPALEQKYAEVFGEKEQYPVPLCYGAGGKDEFPFREKIIQRMTVCPELSLMNYETLGEAWWLDMIGFAYLYLPRPAESPEIVMWYLSNGELVPEPLRDPEDGTVVGGNAGIGICGEDGFILDCGVASEKAFFRSLRIIAPVLKSYGAKLVTVKQDGVTVYDCGYTFNISETESK